MSRLSTVFLSTLELIRLSNQPDTVRRNGPSMKSDSTSDPPKYQQSLVSFIDVLGFRNLVSRATVPQIIDVLRGKERLTSHWGHGFPMEPWDGTTFTFSDLIVNVTSLREPYPLYGLFEEFTTLGFRQLMLATQGIFVRCGIVFEDIYVDGRMIFGPALIKAYDLEKTTAKWPILAFDPDLVQCIDLMSAQHLANREKEGNEGLILGTAFLMQLRALISRTKEGVHFLDYLSCAAYMDSTTGDMRHYLKDHRDSLLAAPRKHGHWKYPFLAAYHDCRKYFSSGPDLIVGELS